MLIMGQPNGSGPNFLNQFHILPVMFRQQGISYALAVLMSGHTVQRIRLSIQIKAVILGNFKGTAAKTRGYSINHTVFGAYQIRRSSVKVWVFTPIPQVHLWNGNFCGSYVVFCYGFCCFQDCSFCVRNSKYHLSAVFWCSNIGFQFYIGIGSVNNRCNLNSWGTIII